MLPMLRILPVGGVLLAVMLLALALSSPGGTRAQLTANVAPVRGAMIERGEHPEWRQFLMLAAIQRAGELSRLRELPDTPDRTDPAPAAPKAAGLPTDRSDSDPEADETGPIAQPPAATIPVDIGESSSVELPVAAPEEKPPVTKTPQLKSQRRIKGVHHWRRARAAVKPTAAQPSIFDALFGNQTVTPAPTYGNQKIRRPRIYVRRKAPPAPTSVNQSITPAPTSVNQSITPAPISANQAATPAPTSANQAATPAPAFDNQTITQTPPVPSNYY
jgi:hypothetical protein